MVWLSVGKAMKPCKPYSRGKTRPIYQASSSKPKKKRFIFTSAVNYFFIFRNCATKPAASVSCTNWNVTSGW